MKVNVSYHDIDALTVDEVVAQAKHNYGKMVQVTVSPETNTAESYIYFGLQQLVTHEQLSLLFDRNANYQQDIKHLRNTALFKVTELLDKVLLDNEDKVS